MSARSVERGVRVTNAALRAEVARMDEHYQRTGELDRILFAALLRELDIRGAAYPDEIGGRA